MAAALDRHGHDPACTGFQTDLINSTISNPDTGSHSNEAIGQGQPAESVLRKNYRGFVAGIFSGIAKLTVGHPFDTIKVRLQTTDASHFRGPWDCVLQTLRKEGAAGLYKGATPPLVGWMAMDSIMLGSLTFYRRLLHEQMFVQPTLSSIPGAQYTKDKLPAFGHGIAGMMAGATVSFIAAPVEHVKARLQIQYAANKADRLYSGPIDCTRKIMRHHGIKGLYHGLGATLIFRSFFFFWWGSYDLFTQAFQKHTTLSTPAVNFWAGGLSAQVFWLTSYPSDVVKQRIMTDPLGGRLGDGQPRFFRWRDAVRTVYQENGLKGYWRGFVPCFLRAFPANAMALVAFEGVMRWLPK
jgi:solute carrier family 25 carnitine/acylcarnitine transporter 20/29